MKQIAFLFSLFILTGCNTTPSGRSTADKEPNKTFVFSWNWYGEKWAEIQVTEKMLASLERDLLPDGPRGKSETNQFAQITLCQKKLIELANQYNGMQNAERVRAFTERGLPPQVNVTINIVPLPPPGGIQKPPVNKGVFPKQNVLWPSPR